MAATTRDTGKRDIANSFISYNSYSSSSSGGGGFGTALYCIGCIRLVALEKRGNVIYV